MFGKQAFAGEVQTTPQRQHGIAPQAGAFSYTVASLILHFRFQSLENKPNDVLTTLIYLYNYLSRLIDSRNMKNSF